MKLNNSALQELYDTMMNLPLSISPYEESPIEKAFRECDEKLSESITFEHIKKLENDIDIWKRSNEILLSANADLANKKKKLEKDLDDVKNQLNYCTHSRDNWRSRAKYAEDEVKKLNETFEKVNAYRTELQKDRDSYHELYTELSKSYNKLSEDNKKLKARTDCHRYEVEWYRKHYKEQSDKIKELKRVNSNLQDTVQDLSIKAKRHQINVGKESRYLWDMLQNVNDTQPNEFDVECESMHDIIGMDLDDFLDAYKKWQEEKEKERLDHMRDYLARFCEGRLCSGCPLESNEYKCGCGYSFKKAADWDMKIIPDEELERYYNKAWHGDADCMKGTRKRVKEACDAFSEGLKAGLASEVKEVPVSCDIPGIRFKDLSSWECTIEATVEVNKDLLEKVCGVKPEEEAHKLEYGDAVRIHWRDYDYMYIGPDEKEGALVRLFDPKNHAIVTTHIANVRYNGGKIILTNEDDLRMIWKDKK